ncbi:MAG: hypothetical protein PHY12_11835 [Eubacteriales bacterium]|nr:hypothetical protein [Eubacteriales bacterium]
MRTVFKREFLSYFRTPVGYVFIGVFLTLSGVIFYVNHLQTLSGELLIFLSSLTLLVMLLTPVLTMRLLCEERQSGADQLLFTSPVALSRIVLGKFFAAAAVMGLTIALTNVFTLIVALYGTVYGGEWLVGYLGFTLQSLSFLALDLFITCFARGQITAAITAFAANFILWMIDLLAGGISVPFVADALSFLSLYGRYEPFVIGQLSWASVVYFLAFIVACLAATIRVLDARRFAKGGAA